MNSCLLSVIIPVFNVEEYIECCLDSILSCKSINLMEIILVDDGSNDSSLELIKMYQQNKSNVDIKIFTQENKGAAETRNKGVMEAKGLYVWFVDGDDLIIGEKLDLLIPTLEKEKLDMLLFNYVFLHSSGRIERHSLFDLKTTDVISGVDLFIKNRVFPSPWNKFLRRDFLIENDLWFKPDILPEDNELMPRCLFFAKHVKCVAIDLYFWRVTPNSLSKRTPLKHLEGYIKTLHDHLQLACKYPDQINFWLKDMAYILFSFNNVVISSGELDYLEKEQEIVRKIIKQIPMKFTREYFLLILISINPYLFFGIKKILKRKK